MSHPVSGIDHCFLLVHDLDRSLDQFERMGFTISPRGLHSARKGTANHTVMLSKDDYFELLGVVAATDENLSRRDLLQRDGEGLHALACRIDDAESAKTELAALGIQTGPVQKFERPVPLPDGSERLAAFSTLVFSREEVPVGIAFMCQHHTRDVVWLPELMAHRNGAKALAGIIAVHDAPELAAQRHARLFAKGRIHPVSGGWQVDTGNVPVTFLSGGELKNRYPGLDVDLTPRGGFCVLQVAVEDIDRTSDLLAREGIEARRTARGIAVDPSLASGVVMEFVPE